MHQDEFVITGGRQRGITCLCFGLSILLVLCDQAAKHLAEINLKQKQDIRLIPDVLHLHYLYPENRGIAFGMMQGKVLLFAVITGLMMAAILFVLIRIPKNRHYLVMTVTCILLFAGAGGNLIDRVFRGYVIDFIYFILIDFPVFNLADVFVVTGGILLILSGLLIYKNEDDFAFLKIRK